MLTLVLVAVTVALAYRGWSFYKLSLEDRPEHAEFRKLRPSGVIGNGYGWVAAMLIVMNLSYLIRRRFGGARLGSMRVWLDLHVFTGLLAASLVSFHSAFQLRTPIATASAASLLVVVLTGLIGRFLFALAPAGERERLRAALDAVATEFPQVAEAHAGEASAPFRVSTAGATAPDLRAQLAEAIGEKPGPVVPANASLMRSLFSIPSWRRAGKVRRDVIALLLPPRREQTSAQRKVTKELMLAAAAEARASGVSALLRTWRAIHRFFALLMLAAVLLHAGVAWYYGYRWIFA